MPILQNNNQSISILAYKFLLKKKKPSCADNMQYYCLKFVTRQISTTYCVRPYSPFMCPLKCDISDNTIKSDCKN